MTGLETILKQIESDAQAQAEEILSEAKAQANTTLEAAKLEGERRSKEIMDQAQRRADSIRARAESAALLVKRDQILQCKQQLIRTALRQVCNALETAPEEQYFQILLGMAERFAQPGDGQMFLNAFDLNRLPPDFEANLDRVSPSGKITLSKTPREIESGFLLVYGDVDINCTFSALFEGAMDQLRDVAGEILFAQV